MWPFSRRSRRGGDDPTADAHPGIRPSQHADGRARPVFGASGPPSWPSLPPMAPSLPPVVLTLNRFFQGELASFEDTRLTAEPLGHIVSPKGPAGHVEGLAVLRLVTAQRGGGGRGPELVYAIPPTPSDEAWPAPLPPATSQAPGRRSITPDLPRSVMTSAAGTSLSGHAAPATTSPPRLTQPRPLAARAGRPTERGSTRSRVSEGPAAQPPDGAAAASEHAPLPARRRSLGAPLSSRPPTAQRLAASGVGPRASAPAPPGATSSVPAPPRRGGVRRLGPAAQRQPHPPGGVAPPPASAPPAAPTPAAPPTASRLAAASSQVEPPATQRAEGQPVAPSPRRQTAAGDSVSPLGATGGATSMNLPLAGEGPSWETQGGGATTPPDEHPSAPTPLVLRSAIPPTMGQTTPVAPATSSRPTTPSSAVPPPVAPLTADRVPIPPPTGPVGADPLRAVGEPPSTPDAPSTAPARAPVQRSTLPGKVPTVKSKETDLTAASQPRTASPTGPPRPAGKHEATSSSRSAAAAPFAPPVPPAAPPSASPQTGHAPSLSPPAVESQSTPTQREAAPLVGGHEPPPTASHRGSPEPVAAHTVMAQRASAPPSERHSARAIPDGLPLVVRPAPGDLPDSASSDPSERPSPAGSWDRGKSVARPTEPFRASRPLVGSRLPGGPSAGLSARPTVGVTPVAAAAGGGSNAGSAATIAQRTLVARSATPVDSPDLARPAPPGSTGGKLEPTDAIAAATIPSAVPAPFNAPQLPLARPAAPAPSSPSPEAFSMTTPPSARAGHQHAAPPPRLPAVRPGSAISRSVSEPGSVTARPSALKATRSAVPVAAPAPRSVQRTATTQRQPDSSAAPGVDVDALADQVLRRVRDQLRLDRERRGTIADRKG